MATENERPSRDNDGEGKRPSGRNESGRPYSDRGEKKIFNRRDKYEDREGGERRSYGNDRREDRKPYGDRREGGDRKPYGDRREGGERRSFGGDRERKPYGDRREGGERRSFGGDRREESGERRSFGGDRNRNAGDGADGGVKSFSLRRGREERGNDDDRGERRDNRRFDDNRGDRRNFREDRGENRSERKPYSDRNEGGEGRNFGGDRERRPYNNDRREGGERRFDGERGERKSFGGDRREGGERRSFDGNREERGERRSFGGDRDRKPYGDRREGGERKSYGDRREGGEGRSFGGDRREGGERRSFGGDRERKPYGDRREGGERRSFGSDRREGGERRSYGGERKSFDRKDKFSKGGEERRGHNFDSNPDADHNPDTPNYDLRRYKDNPRIKKTNRKGEDEDGSIRLNRYIANAGVCSRREADELILAGEIKVNGEAVTEMGFKVQPSDTVMYGKKVLSREKMVYVLLNKPKDFITTTEDPEGRKTVMSLVEKASKERIFPVGRLDRNTTGLLLFTNDGELAQKLTHPSNEIKKIYQVELDKPITKDDFQKVVEGVELEDGKAVVDDVAMLGDSKKFLGLEIHIGRNRIVRRIFEHLGYEVVTLDRVQYAGLTKKDLPRSEWRYLSEKEVIRLKYFM